MNTFIDLKRAIKAKLPYNKTIKVALLGDTATQLMSTAIIGEGAIRGFKIELWEAAFNQVERQILDPSSDYHKFCPNYTVVFQSTHKLLEKHSNLGPSGQRQLADDRLSDVKSIAEMAEGRLIYFNYPEIDDTIYGSYSAKIVESFQFQLAKLNLGLMELAQAHQNLYICNLSGVSAKYGRNFMFSPSIYTNTETILSVDSLPIVASRVLDIISSTEGCFKKCLILDLDNTLWGGVVGDDGWENIQIGHGLGIGKAFTEFQEWIKKLKNRGIILCICSKNDEKKAKEPFEKNPEMVLKLEDIAVFIANWNNKADNICTIRDILNIGFDSMVFIDDNPFERNIVRQNITGITVPEMPDDPAEYVEYLYSLNLFETASYSTLDHDRTRQYQNEAKRVVSQAKFANEADFLKSLNMLAKTERPNSFNIPRIAQLSQRSNQFNLRTIRYTEDDIINIAKDPYSVALAFSLEDKYGEHGLISVVILLPTDNNALFLDTWFMSCRVLNRGMEQFVLNTVVDEAVKLGYNAIIGEYIPSPKNGIVENLLPQMGFTRIDGQSNRILYSLDLNNYQSKDTFIKCKN